MNEIRNELLLIRTLAKESKDGEDKKMQLEWLLQRFEYDIKNQLKDIQYKEEELLDNLKTLEYVRKELKIGE